MSFTFTVIKYNITPLDIATSFYLSIITEFRILSTCYYNREYHLRDFDCEEAELSSALKSHLHVIFRCVSNVKLPA